MKRTVQTWKDVFPAAVVGCSEAHIFNLVTDARADILQLCDVANAAALAQHHVNNALTPLFGALQDMTSSPQIGGLPQVHTWDLSPADTRACLERIRDAMLELQKVREAL